MTPSNTGQELAATVTAKRGGTKDGLARRTKRGGTRSESGPRKSAATLRDVPLTDINIDDTTYQYRFNGDGEDLLLSLRLQGQEEPIDLKGDAPPYVIVDGHRRMCAAAKLGWTSVKAFVHADLTDEKAWRLAFTKNVTRKNLSPIEQANAMVLALQRGVTKTDLPQVFLISDRQVQRYLKLMDLPEHIQGVLDGKVVTMAHALVLAKHQIQNAVKWRGRIKHEQLDAKALERTLRTERGKNSAGRPRRYVKQDKTGIRVYPFKIAANAPKDERQKLLESLRPLIEMLEKD